MNELTIFNQSPEMTVFNSETFGEIRIIELDGEPWFVAADVCRAIGIGNPSEAVRRLDEDEKALSTIEGLSKGNERGNVINEPGLYSLILVSRKPEAKAFKRWITHEIIPAIRKHGAYMTPATIEEVLLTPDTIIKIATALKEEQEKNKVLTAKNAELAPKALFAEAVSASETSILIGDLAKILTQNGMKIGQNRLFERLRNEGYLIKRKGDSRNLPTQEAMEMGLFEIKERVHMRPDGTPKINRTPVVTGKGQVYFINKYIGKKQ